MLDCWHDLSSASIVGAELVGDHGSWRAARLLQQTLQQAFGRFGIAPHMDDIAATREQIEQLPELAEELERPMVLLVSARKKKAR